MERVDFAQTKSSLAMSPALPATSPLILENFSVVIPTLGRPTLEKCLQALYRGRALPAQVIVVDQGSNTAVADWLAPWRAAGIRVSHLTYRQRGVATARNRGIEQVQTSFAAMIDDDCLAEIDWLEKMAIRLHQHSTSIITGRVNPGGEGFVVSCVTSEVPLVYTRPVLRGNNPPASGNMGFALSTAQQVGPFDERLNAASEDGDWGYRALRMGITIHYAPEVIVYHLDWRDRELIAATFKTYAWATGIWYSKYVRRGDWFMILRTALYLYRGVRSLIYGVLLNNYEWRAEGYARVTRFMPGLIAGLLAHRS